MSAVSMIEMAEREHELTVSQVAERLDVTYRTALKRIRDGLIRARLEGSEYRVTEADLETYIQRSYGRRRGGKKDQP